MYFIWLFKSNANLLFPFSDSLHRHLARHGESFKPSSSRSKSACLSCHAAKIKCDGDKQCQNCVKKGVECKYRSNDTDSVPQLDEKVRQLEVSDSGVSMNDNSSPENNSASPSDTQSVRMSTPSFPIQRSEAYINWSSVRIQKDDEPITLYRTPNVDLYFAHIHHRFPIIHRPSYIAETKGRTLQLLKSSMEMIGAWLEGSHKSRQFALELHQKLMAECLLDIVSVISKVRDHLEANKPHSSLTFHLLTYINNLYRMVCVTPFYLMLSLSCTVA